MVTTGASTRPDLEDELTKMLHSAASAPLLWRRLLLFDPHHGNADMRDAEQALRRLHSHGQAGAATTALMLLTSWQWRRHTDELLRRLLAADVLDDGDLDELAEVGVFDDEALFVLPATVFAGLVIVLPERDEAGPDPVDPRDVLPVRMSRPLRPPVRRWAAGHLLRRDPGRLDEVRQRIGGLDAQHAAAGTGGVLDVLDVLPHAQAEAVLQDILRWPHRSVRLRALRLLAARGRHDEAVLMAQNDPDASIRAAATRLSPVEPQDPATLF